MHLRKDVDNFPEQPSISLPVSTAADPNLVGWDGPDDPSNPKNWSFKYRCFIVIVVCTLGANVSVPIRVSSINFLSELSCLYDAAPLHPRHPLLRPHRLPASYIRPLNPPILSQLCFFWDTSQDPSSLVQEASSWVVDP